MTPIPEKIETLISSHQLLHSSTNTEKGIIKMASYWYFKSNFCNSTIKKLKKMGKVIVLICSSKSPTDSEFVFSVGYSTETG